MSHSYVQTFIHYVFSTKEREKLITPELENRLWPYIGGIARENGMKALAVGGITDHIHTLISLPSSLSVAKGVQLLKGVSSKWVHDKFPEHKHFSWQEGYGAFSVSPDEVESVVSYIHNQKEHHRRKTFQEEFIELLELNGIDYDPRYVFR